MGLLDEVRCGMGILDEVRRMASNAVCIDLNI
jgi:hypothetical protein